MTARAFADGVSAVLGGEPTFIAAIQALIGLPVATVLRGNIPLQNIPTGSVPCWVVEQGDGRAKSASNDGADEGMVIGLSEQQFESELFITLVWSEQDRTIAANQRADLPTLVTQLMLRNPTPGGIAFAHLAEWEPDRGVHHPLQVWRATVLGEYAVSKT